VDVCGLTKPPLGIAPSHPEACNYGLPLASSARSFGEAPKALEDYT